MKLFGNFILSFSILIFTFWIFLLPQGAHAQDITTGLVGHWKFDEGSGTTASDSSGNNNTGTLSPPAGGPTWMAGKINGTLSFDGIDDGVNIGQVLHTITGAMTVGGWIKANSFSNATYQNEMAVVNKLTSGGRGYQLSVANDRTVFSISSNCEDIVSVTQTSQLAVNTWHHIVGVFIPSSALQIYVDGVLVTQITSAIPAA